MKIVETPMPVYRIPTITPMMRYEAMEDAQFSLSRETIRNMVESFGEYLDTPREVDLPQPVIQSVNRTDEGRYEVVVDLRAPTPDRIDVTLRME